MLLIKLLFLVLVISLVKSVPVDERKNSDRNRLSTRRATLETYRYNHPPSISIPVSVVFEENEPETDKSGKSLKLNTGTTDGKTSPLQAPSSVAIPVSVVMEKESSDSGKSKNINTKTPDKNLLSSQELQSVAIPVSVVFEEETFGSYKSEKLKQLNQKVFDKGEIPSHKPSFEAIPVPVVFEEKETQSDKILKFEKQNPEIIIRKTTTIDETSDIAVPVSLAFQERVSKNNSLKSEKTSRNTTYNKQAYTKETNNVAQINKPAISTSTDSIISENDIELPTTNTSSAELNPNAEKSKISLKPQPKQYHQLEYQIPVAVIYDEPINEVITRRKLNNSKEKVRARNSRSRRPTSTKPTTKTITTGDDTQTTPLISKVKPNTRISQQVKQTQEKSSDKENNEVPVSKIIKNEHQNPQHKRREEKPSTTSVPTTKTSLEKLTSSTRTQSKTPLQTQNRNTSFKAQQTEERRQDNESVRKRERDPVVPIIKSDNHAYGNSGSFSYSYEGGDGTKAFEKGELKTFEGDKTGESVVGGFSYKDKDGNDFSLSYTADENGYRPVGDHLPTPPPIPVAIQRALAYLATKTTPAPVTEAGEA